MGLLGSVLVSPAPVGPGEGVGQAVELSSGGQEESSCFGQGDGDEAGGGVRVSDGGGDVGEQGVGEHGQGGPAVPGVPAADLVLVEADVAFGGLEVLLDSPALSGHGDEVGEGDVGGVVAAVVGELAGGVVAADHQPVVAGAVGFGLDRDPGRPSARAFPCSIPSTMRPSVSR